MSERGDNIQSKISSHKSDLKITVGRQGIREPSKSCSSGGTKYFNKKKLCFMCGNL